MRLLLADDVGTFRDDLASLLEARGHTVTAVDSVKRATEALEQGEFDVLFSELRLGRQSGLELLTESRNRWPRMSVVMLTGKGTVETAVEALHQGAFDYLRKPVNPEQVQRVLDLVGQQLALIRTGAKPLDPLQYATSLAAEGGYEVLLISPPPVHVTSEKVSHLPLDPENPFRIREAVEEFAVPKERAAVVLAAVEQLLARHREEEIAALLDRIRVILEGKGPLAVGYDPNKITATGALAVRASIVSAEAGATLDSLANPIRRLVLRRLADGPSSFMQAMESAHIDDTSLIAFHLRKLTESGLITHLARERYQLTARGQGAIKILNSIDALDSGQGSGNRIFPSKSPKRTPS
ncbi:MAG: response regulator [Thermoplasmata archaeon]|jgi:ActR/RegA family two-component response regulator/DNA-binding HxlR family transcriptional regulator